MAECNLKFFSSGCRMKSAIFWHTAINIITTLSKKGLGLLLGYKVVLIIVKFFFLDESTEQQAELLLTLKNGGFSCGGGASSSSMGQVSYAIHFLKITKLILRIWPKNF